LHFDVVGGQGEDEQAIKPFAAWHSPQALIAPGNSLHVVENQVVAGSGQHVLDSLQALNIGAAGEKGRDDGHRH
jgi:hypothetical protein